MSIPRSAISTVIEKHSSLLADSASMVSSHDSKHLEGGISSFHSSEISQANAEIIRLHKYAQGLRAQLTHWAHSDGPRMNRLMQTKFEQARTIRRLYHELDAVRQYTANLKQYISRLQSGREAEWQHLKIIQSRTQYHRRSQKRDMVKFLNRQSEGIKEAVPQYKVIREESGTHDDEIDETKTESTGTNYDVDNNEPSCLEHTFEYQAKLTQQREICEEAYDALDDLKAEYTALTVAHEDLMVRAAHQDQDLQVARSRLASTSIQVEQNIMLAASDQPLILEVKALKHELELTEEALHEEVQRAYQDGFEDGLVSSK